MTVQVDKCMQWQSQYIQRRYWQLQSFNSKKTEIIKTKSPKGSKSECGENIVMVVKEFTGICKAYMYGLSNSTQTVTLPNTSFFEELDMDSAIQGDDFVLVDSRYDKNKKS